MCLLVFTSARRSDIVKLGPQNIELHDEKAFLVFQQQKVRKSDPLPVFAPIDSYLRHVIDCTQIGQRTFLINVHGDPFSAKAFGARFKKWVKAAV